MGKDTPLAATPNTKLHRLPARGSYDRALAYAILDEGLHCAVGIVSNGQPFVMPMAYARVEDELILHGASASRLLKTAGSSYPVCVTVTLLDGLVLARSAFHHSMNYRSVVVLGQAVEITDPGSKLRALDALVDHVVPGRSRDVRPANAKELAATRVLALPIEEASVKVRSGGPIDDEEDLDLSCWAGHLPLTLQPLAPIADAQFPPKGPLPASVGEYARPRMEGH